MSTNTIQIRKKGSLTLPIDLRNKYQVDEGDIFTLIDLGDGSFLLTPRISQVNRLGDRIAEIIDGEGLSTTDLLNALDDERERYYQEHYAKE
ncbi:MAG: AbrB/MazE/SpoVT family DNA-binding domain-containing protein [bacterium]